MRLAKGRIGFYAAVGVCNIMTWGMFNVLNMPRIDASQFTNSQLRPAIIYSFKATVGMPTHLTVPSLGMDIPVSQGSFDPATQEWSISDDSAYFALGSTPINDSNGTTLIYGHARPTMFEPLKNVSPGAIVEVHTDNSKVFTYTFTSMREVVPTDTSVFTDVGPPTVVLQTCSGPWDRYRALYSFQFVGMRNV